jgi:CheY-like chemotaxis protein
VREALTGYSEMQTRRVLIADDNRDGADSLALLLRMAGREVLVVHDGAEAQKVAHVFRPHVAILDIGMPKRSGYEVAQAIRTEPWGSRVLLIAVTGWGQPRDRQLALTAGFDHQLGHLFRDVFHRLVFKAIAGSFSLASADPARFSISRARRFSRMACSP